MGTMGDLLERFLREPAAPSAALRALTCAIPAAEPEALWRAELLGPRVYWRPALDATGGPNAWDPMAFAGVGCAHEVDASELGGAHETGLVASGEGPAPRWIGGLAFAPRGSHERPDEVWSGFGAGSFVMPRWTLFRGRERSYLQWVLGAGERDRGALEGECARVLGAIARGGSEGPVGRAEVREEVSLAQWSAMVRRALGRIRERDFAKVVLARRTRVALAETTELPAVLARLGAAQRGCTVFAVERAGGVFLGATPERLLAARAGSLSADALAGSVPRASTPEDDLPLREALLRDGKELREHALVVTAVRDALAARCERGSVRVSERPGVRTLASLHHLYTPVEGTLRAGETALGALEALHPTPAVCGAPRASALDFLRANEPHGRGWYAGPVGWFDAAGDASFCVAIRSAVLRGRDAWAWAGAGIVEGSEPAREYEETAAKQRAVLHALGVES